MPLAELAKTDMKADDLHLGKVILNRLKSFGDRLHQVELTTGASETHASVLLRSIRVAEAMKKRGIGLGDIVVVCGDTHNDISIPIYASTFIGSAFFPLSMTMKKNEVKNMLEVGIPAIIFCDPGIAQIFAEAQAELGQNAEIVVFGTPMPEGNFSSFEDFLKPTGTEEKFQATELDPSKTLVFVACSSGTTGLPKGVCHTHKTFGLNFFLKDSENRRPTEENYKRNSAYMSFSTVYWLSGIISVMTSALAGVKRINCIAPYSVDLLEKALIKYKPTETVMSSAAISELVKHPKFLELDWSSMRIFLVGGSLISPDVMEQMQKQVKNGILIQAYGMTEAGVICLSLDQVTGSVGKIYSWVQWKVVDPETEEVLGPNKVGELRIKADCLFHGYLKNPEATAAAYDNDGYYKSGDLVTFDDDKNIFVVDRIKEMMKYKSYQITPAELEFEIIKLPGVAQVAVVGQKHPDDGDLPLAFVQRVPGSEITTKEIKDCVKNALSDMKQLRGGVVFLPSLPLTPSGKVDRKNLRVLAQQVEGQ